MTVRSGLGNLYPLGQARFNFSHVRVETPNLAGEELDELLAQLVYPSVGVLKHRRSLPALLSKRRKGIFLVLREERDHLIS